MKEKFKSQSPQNPRRFPITTLRALCLRNNLSLLRSGKIKHIYRTSRKSLHPLEYKHKLP